MTTRVTKLLNIQYPLIQGGMVWCSGWELASAVSNAGGLGIIGSGSMYPDELRNEIRKCKAVTTKPFGVNIPLLYADVEKHIDVIIEEEVKIVFTSAGNPAKYTGLLKEHGIKVIHVIANIKFALKAQDAGCDAIVAEGFEAGGHNGREETTTLCLIPLVCGAVTIPVIAAGGIGNGKQMAAAFCLGAEAVQLGTRFVTSIESSAHENFKKLITNAGEGDTDLTLKKLTPVRLYKNDFYKRIHEMELSGAKTEELAAVLGRGRAKQGMLLGDLTEGELEIGQVSSQIKSILPAKEIIREIMSEFDNTIASLHRKNFE